MRLAWGITVVVGALLAVGAAPAAAATADVRCELTGTFKFDSPLGSLPMDTTFKDSATGTCSGTLDGEPVVDTPVKAKGDGQGVLGCLAGKAVLTGALRFDRGTEDDSDDVAVGYTADALSGATEAVAVIRSDGGGVALSKASFHADEATLAACETGTLESIGYTTTVTTLVPASG